MDVGCKVLGDEFLSEPTSPKGRGGAEDENGEGRLWLWGMGAGAGAAYGADFVPEITSEIEGRDCR